jgi:ATP-dependent protease Clp ATPase subunit
MFDLPSLEGVEQVVISQQTVDGAVQPLYSYRTGVAAPTSDGKIR